MVIFHDSWQINQQQIIANVNKQKSRMSSTKSNSALLENTNTKGNNTINDTLEDIFGFTIDPSHGESRGLLYLEEVRNVHDKKELDLNLLQYALFERLFMCNEDIPQKGGNEDSHVWGSKVIKYLYTCLKNLHQCSVKLKPEEQKEIRDKIIQNVATPIMQSDLYADQDIAADVLQILKDGEPEAGAFFIDACKKVLEEENNNNESLRKFIDAMNKIVVDELIKSFITGFPISVFNYLNVIASNAILGEIFMDSCIPKKRDVGSEYALTPIGALLNLSALPKSPIGKYEHFTNPMDPVGNSSTETLLWSLLDKLNQNLHQFVLAMLRLSPKVKDKMLAWLGDCLRFNSDRGKLWNAQLAQTADLNPAVYRNVTDGFMLSLCNLLLSLCQPFCSKIKDEKILKIDPTYCAVPNDQLESKNVHMFDMSKETCFLPVSSNEGAEEERLTADSYNFMTECFYMAHKSIDLGYRVGVDKMLQLNHELARIERAFNDAAEQHGVYSDLVGTVKDRMSEELSKYLSLKCTLSDPNLMQKMFNLISATAYWLGQVTVHGDTKKIPGGYAPLTDIPVQFPLPDNIPSVLKCIPEFLVENTVSFLVFVRRFTPKSFEEQGYEKLSPILTYILIYMGSQQHMSNPHIRARLAEGLESVLPFHKDEPPGNTLGGSQREKLFKEHPHRHQIVDNLLKVFVGIEMTGQSVEFEQKFNYRRPMYTIFDYLWELPEHRECFKKLAIEAEQNMEAVNPPIFLRFANLLINDAIFLLDEALANMAKLKEMQRAQDNGEWSTLNARDRVQNISYMQHIGNMARFDNILGKDTINTLEKLTSEITRVFTHSTMVDRIAAMLNYFLLNLVGPNKKNFKVKNAKEYQFDPAGTVLKICKIYVNLKESDSFCLAVSQDGRSYSPSLFTLSEDVLVRIGGGSLIGEMKEVAEKVAQRAHEQEAREEATAEAPEHFLDPIMSTLMTDPVILPSSKQTVDRTTIARHLLSDQTDPFNRSPLSMEHVTPNAKLKEEIEAWLEERRKK
ncbi:unnamed protein product [Callosobruchus maculatus]|uniref:Ubiquitin conjugation factor E4 A n=1 Tax=Callosobruchus maculatus TaxID=64391 RepID=A0A653BXJ2_CALMS|nr:unnamed protein product [Callosobruchus maculatus]